MDFKDRLINLRKQRGWSQEELGFQVNVSRQTVSKWESGDTTPEMAKLILLSQILEVSLDGLVAGKEMSLPGTPSVTGHVPRGDYEYKSEKTIWGLPLVHINIGRGLRRAKGIIAIGNVATGVVALGGVSLGVVAVGGLGLGLLSLAAVALGLLSFGAVSLGGIALGGVAMGYLALGGVATGSYAIGGVALAEKIAVGGYADGLLAFGNDVSGKVTFSKNRGILQIYPQAFDELVALHLPDEPRWIIRFFKTLLT